ncbi:MAG: hypothetical protein AAFO02_01470 [Bacteroidota bacterium]
MSNKDTENKQLAQDYAGIRVVMILVDFASWKWLAATTAIMVYGSFYNSVSNWIISPGWQMAVLLLIVGVFYLVIDHGLPETLERFIRGKKTVDQHTQVVKAHKRLLSLFILLFVVRLFASGLSSIWAGGEIGDLTTEDFSGDKYIASAALRDSTDNARLSVATTELQDLRGTLEERLAQARARGEKEIAAALKTGNQSQREMWKKRPSFFSPPPQNQYYPQNKAFADRMHEAEANADSYIQEEKNKNSRAEDLVYGVSTDTTSGQYLASLGNAADAERSKLEIKESRRKRLVVISDLLAILFGLLARGIRINIDEVTGRKPNPKSLSYIMASAIEEFRVWLLELLESFLGIDIDGNGTIGSATNRINQQRRIGFQMATNTENPSSSQEPPPPTATNPIGYFVDKPWDSTEDDTSHHQELQWPPVATAPEMTNEDIEGMKMAYKHAKSSYRKWFTKEERGDGTTETNEKNMAKWAGYMDHFKDRLAAQGIEV